MNVKYCASQYLYNFHWSNASFQHIAKWVKKHGIETALTAFEVQRLFETLTVELKQL